MEAENASIFSKVLYMENKDLYDRLSELAAGDIVPLHMPGHKRNTDIFSMSNPYGIDITEIDGFDNLHNADGIIKEDFKRAAKLFGAAFSSERKQCRKYGSNMWCIKKG